jgi:uncharacterized membrane protein YecN with MAPEG domain
MPFEITPLFVAGLVIFQVAITNFVGYRRLQTGIRFLDGGEETLTRRIRAHGNFTETVPIALIAMASAELLGTAPWILWTGGSLLAIGRAWHYFYIVSKGWGLGRSLSMVMTFVAMLIFAISVILEYL